MKSHVYLQTFKYRIQTFRKRWPDVIASTIFFIPFELAAMTGSISLMRSVSRCKFAVNSIILRIHFSINLKVIY